MITTAPFISHIGIQRPSDLSDLSVYSYLIKSTERTHVAYVDRAEVLLWSSLNAITIR